MSFLDLQHSSVTHYPKKMAQNFKSARRLFEDSENEEQEAVSVYLRIKPVTSSGETIEVLDTKTILCKPPKDSNTFKAKAKSDIIKFSFTHIYEDYTTQAELYQKCVLPKIIGFLNGTSCLLFSYGTTNAGKTFTIHGNVNNPGIIPRALQTVFTSIQPFQSYTMRYKPGLVFEVLRLTDDEVEKENEFKKRLLLQYKDAYSKHSNEPDDFYSSEYGQIVQHLDYNRIDIDNKKCLYCVWVSFVEIYNEAIYDLLDLSVPNGATRKQLKLAHDKNNNTYIKGVQEVCVKTSEEAYKILMIGKKNLQIASTALNSSSSRSHCVFTVKLVKYENTDNPQYASVYSFSFCDLAGAERLKKTLNVGDRLKEAQNINISLYTLSRCFKTLRNNQLKNESQRIPYRDSKMTQLFQKAFDGKHGDRIVMLVNVNPAPQLFDETQHVLKTSAVAINIVTNTRNTTADPKMMRFSIMAQKYHQSMPTTTWGSEIQTETDNNNYTPRFSDDSNEDVLMENTMLKENIKEATEKLVTLQEEIELLQEMIKDKDELYLEQVEEFRTFYNDALEKRSAQIKKRYTQQISELKLKLQAQQENKEPVFDKENEVEKLVDEMDDLKATNIDLQKKIQLLEVENDRLKQNHTKIISNINQETCNCSKKYEKQLAEMKELLNEGLECEQNLIHTQSLLENAKGQIHELENDIESKNDLIGHYEAVIERNAEKVEELEKTNEQLKEKLEAAEIQFERTLCLLEKERDDYKYKLSQQNQLIDEIEKERDDYKHKLDEQNKLNAEMENVNAQFEKIRIDSEIDELNSKLEACEIERQHCSEENNNLKNELKMLGELFRKSNDAVKSKDVQLEELQEIINQYKKSKISVYTTDDSLSKDKIYDLECQNAKHQQKIKELESQVGNLKMKIDMRSPLLVTPGKENRRPRRCPKTEPKKRTRNFNIFADDDIKPLSEDFPTDENDAIVCHKSEQKRKLFTLCNVENTAVIPFKLDAEEIPNLVTSPKSTVKRNLRKKR